MPPLNAHEAASEPLHVGGDVPERAELEASSVGTDIVLSPGDRPRKLEDALCHGASEQLAAGQIADATKAVHELGLGLRRQRLGFCQKRVFFDVRQLPPVQRIAG
jgi:hypothetical protein